jgi:multiple sugar transport system permease protein
MSQVSSISVSPAIRKRVLTPQYLLARFALYVVLMFGAAVMAFPFVWMVITSFQSRQESLQAQPVWWPNRLQPANWVAAIQLGVQGGNGWNGGLEVGKTVRFELRARHSGAVTDTLPGAGTDTLRAAVPAEQSAPSGMLFGQEASSTAEIHQVVVDNPRLEGKDTIWTITVSNAGNARAERLPLTINLPERYSHPAATLPPDSTRRDDFGAVLEWTNIVPGGFGYVFENYGDAIRTAPFGRYFLNSTLTALAQVILGTVVVCLAAFAFAQIQFAGRDLAFTLILSSLVIPGEMLLVPNFVTVSRLGWTDSYQALVVPWIASVFGIFLLRQFFLALPAELFEAARLDGASYGTMLWRVALPLARPGLATYAIFSFLGSWNALIWPLIVTSKQEMRTLQVGLQAFIGEAGSNYGQLMAASVMVILPIIIGFLLAQKQFIAGIARSGLK